MYYKYIGLLPPWPALAAHVWLHHVFHYSSSSDYGSPDGFICGQGCSRVHVCSSLLFLLLFIPLITFDLSMSLSSLFLRVDRFPNLRCSSGVRRASRVSSRTWTLIRVCQFKLSAVRNVYPIANHSIWTAINKCLLAPRTKIFAIWSLMCLLQWPRAASSRRRGEHCAHAGARAWPLLSARQTRRSRARRHLRAGRRGPVPALSFEYCTLRNNFQWILRDDELKP